MKDSSNIESSVKSSTIGVRLFCYFTGFTLVIMVLLWLLQILFFQLFYQEMKIRELYTTATSIEESYGEDELFTEILTLTRHTDMYVQIETDQCVLFSSNAMNPGDRMDVFGRSFNTSPLKEELASGNVTSVVSKQESAGRDNQAAMIYASKLDTLDGIPIYLFVYAPLTAVGTTVEILAKMLIMVTIISVVIGIIVSVVISKRLARPLNNITKSAALLAEGNYEARFDGHGYAETEELAATLNYASDELSKSDKLQKDLIANVTHDLKTPLTMVKSYAEMIRDLSGNNPEKRDKHLQVIIGEADRLNELVNDLTMLSKMQANVDALELSDVDLAGTARATFESFSLHAEQDGFQFLVETEGSPVVTADQRKISQVFANLIGNAIRYSGDDKHITVRVTDKGSFVRCEVSDHGQGIAPEDLNSVWDRYYQSSKNLSRTSQGTGLGLAIVKQIFILHRARYGVESVLDQGSTFWFELDRPVK